MKNILKSTLAAALLLSLFSGTGSALAENASSPSVGASANLAVPAGYTVIPPKDDDRSNDQIVQLENLTIQKTSGTVPGTVYASRDIGGPCREYLDISGSAGSKVYPCPMAPTVLYQISVQSDTILLLKNRTRATIKDFEVGDRINVFGFLDRGTSGVQALIMRDLDKPASTEGRYVQLNNLTVATGPDAKVPPANFRAARKGVEPCFAFDGAVSGRAIVSPCPMGTEISVSDEILNDTTVSDYRPFRQYYNIRVTANTKLMNLNRQAISLSDIQAGDMVNVYGRYIAGTRMVEALIVRNLSMPRRDDGTATLTVAVIDKSVTCVTTPCGQADGMLVTLRRRAAENTKDMSVVVASQVTVDGQVAFRGLKPGYYTVTATGGGYSTAEQSLTLVAGQAGKMMLYVRSSSSGDDTSRPPSISSISPESGTHETRVTLRGKNFAKSGNVVYFNNYYIASLESKDGRTLEFAVPQYISPCAMDPYSSDRDNDSVACIMIAMELPDGTYKVRVATESGVSNSVAFKVGSDARKLE